MGEQGADGPQALSCGLLSYFLVRRLASSMAFAFEKLQVDQKAVTFADAVCTLTKGFPRGHFFLADQLNRAALSIAANIAEGNGRSTKPDRKDSFGIARGSAQECVPLLELTVRQNLTTPKQHEQLRADLEEIARMLSVSSTAWTSGNEVHFPADHLGISSRLFFTVDRLRRGRVECRHWLSMSAAELPMAATPVDRPGGVGSRQTPPCDSSEAAGTKAFNSLNRMQ